MIKDSKEYKDLERELIFMYNKYSEVCLAYKKLAAKIDKATELSSHDQSNMLYDR
jgi:hypothetical protein